MPISDSKTQVKPTSKTRKQVIGVAAAACIAVAILVSIIQHPNPERQFVEAFGIEVADENFRVTPQMTIYVMPHVTIRDIYAEVLVASQDVDRLFGDAVPWTHSERQAQLEGFELSECREFLPPTLRDRVGQLEPIYRCHFLYEMVNIVDPLWWLIPCWFHSCSYVSTSYLLFMEEQDGQVLVLMSVEYLGHFARRR